MSIESINQIIDQLIAENGFIEVDKFVNLCLYHDEFGYYKQQNPFGLKGDFVTSPQMTTIFGEMIALYIASYWNKINDIILQSGQQPKKLTIIELGGGNGFFMRDCLNTLKQFPNIIKNIDIIMVESSEKLTAEQKTILKPFFTTAQILWLKDLYTIADNLDSNSNVFVFSNEFFDAFSIKQFIKIDKFWREIVIKHAQDESPDESLTLKPYQFAHNSSIDFSSQVEEYLVSSGINEEIADESIVEISLGAIDAYNYISQMVVKQGGQIMTIDYGYIKPALDSTLKAVRQHQEVDIFANLGTCDITHLVNFTAINNIAVKNNLFSYGILTQGEFLTSIGIKTRLEMFVKSQSKKIADKTAELKDVKSLEQRREIEAEIEKIKAKIHLTTLAIERVISPKQMGDLFKVHIVECN